MTLRRLFSWMQLAAAVLAVALLAAACGGGGGDGGAADGGAADGGDGGDVTVVDPATAGSVSGKISFTGTAPEPEVIQMDSEPGCQAQYTDGPFTETVVVNRDGTLANVFVYVKSGLEGMTFATPTEPVVLDQKGCRYHPHVFGAQTDQTIAIRNSDDNLHNIHPQPVNGRAFNVSQPTQGMETERSFSAAEVMVTVGCDVHNWMSAYIGVLDHPYFAVTGGDGAFELPNLPPGDYVIEAWHELYGAQTMNVTVGPSQQVMADFTFASS